MGHKQYLKPLISTLTRKKTNIEIEKCNLYKRNGNENSSRRRRRGKITEIVRVRSEIGAGMLH
jgi:hypothetical protein